jgi:hypothetical protein
MSVQSNIFNINRTQTVKQEILTGSQSTKLAPMGLGMEMRARPKNYPEVVGNPRSVQYQTDNITTTERSIGMPTGSVQDIYSRLTGTTGSALQISSTSVNDTGAGTGALTIYINGIYKSNDNWFERGTFSTPTTLNGQTAVQIGTEVDWYRINKIFVLTTGSSETNEGDLYISPLSQSLTAGVPDAMTLLSVIAGFSTSSGGFFSVATSRGFHYTKGNFWIDPTKAIRLHEFYYQDFNGSANTEDMTKYEVGVYPSNSASYDYTGAASYTPLTDIALTVSTTSGTADAMTYYVEYILTDTSKTN